DHVVGPFAPDCGSKPVLRAPGDEAALQSAWRGATMRRPVAMILQRRERWVARAREAVASGSLEDIGRALGVLHQLDDQRTPVETALHLRLKRWLETETYAVHGVRM